MYVFKWNPLVLGKSDPNNKCFCFQNYIKKNSETLIQKTFYKLIQITYFGVTKPRFRLERKHCQQHVGLHMKLNTVHGNLTDAEGLWIRKYSFWCIGVTVLTIDGWIVKRKIEKKKFLNPTCSTQQVISQHKHCCINYFSGQIYRKQSHRLNVYWFQEVCESQRV